jgi:transposase-like protein
MRKPSVDELIKAIKKGKGNVSAVARGFGVPRSSVYNWIIASPTAQAALADEREAVVDDAESVLYAEIIARNMTAVAYVLNNSPEAKRRGWGPKAQIEHSGQIDTPITIVKENRRDS